VPVVEDGCVEGGAEFAKRPAGRFALREMKYLREWAEQVMVLLLLGAVFGWIGPYGTFQDLSIVNRFIYWITAFLLIGLGASFTKLAIAQAEPCKSWPAPVQAIVAALVAAVPSSFVVIALETIFRHPPAITLANLLRIYVSVAVVMIAIGIPWAVIRKHRAHAVSVAQPTQTLGAPPAIARNGDSPFLRRLPAKLGTDLLCVATEDHYLRVTTTLGHDLILFRLSDAMAELDPALGQQVHRSYWVARRAVAGVERNGQRTALLLTNGATIPISRTFLPALREAGWLKG
jgi:hypothetical protein